jgi:hypothetical protein
MQLKLQIFLLVGIRFIPSEMPNRLLLTGPKIISSKRNVAIILCFYGGKINNICRIFHEIASSPYFIGILAMTVDFTSIGSTPFQN